MARRVSWGTPYRSSHYLKPRRPWALVVPALALGGGALALLLLFEAVGFRSPLSPGAVSKGHAVYASACRECHLARAGAPDVRCQRCHDASGAGRMTNAAHVYFGSLDPARSAAAPDVACARCHVEHKGAAARLRLVDEGHCTGCHADAGRFQQPIARFAAHPEFRVLATPTRQAAGITYSHLTHVTKGRNKPAGYVTLDRKLDAPARSCPECHQLQADGKDFAPISFEEHCLSCHRADLNKMDPVPAAEVVGPQLLDEELAATWGTRPEDFETDSGGLVKLRIFHKDGWVLFNVRKLQRELDPEGFAAERAALVARQGRLERRLALATPPAGQDLTALEARAATLEREIAYLDSRLSARSGAVGPEASLDRVEEVAKAASASGSADSATTAQELLQRAAALRVQTLQDTGLASGDFEARRGALLRLLDAIEKADPERTAQVEELRRRLGALVPGGADAGLVERARAQRRAELTRLRDELELRRSGTQPPSQALLDAERQAIRVALERVRAELRVLDAVPEPAGTLSTDAIVRKQLALTGLTKGCRYCHEISDRGRFAPVAAARPVLWRSAFAHRDHLTQGEACASCHAGGEGDAAWSVETSDKASDLSFRGVASCRACHRSGKASQGCQFCHNYHPPSVP